MRRWLTPERLIRWSLGLVYLWFGALKLIGMSPVLELVRNAYEPLATVPLYVGLALFELLLASLLIAGVWRRAAAAGVAVHLVGTLSVLVTSPHVAFLPRFPFLTLEGEFIVKNVVLLATAGALWVGIDPAPEPRPQGPTIARWKAMLLAGAAALLAGLVGHASLRLHETQERSVRPSASATMKLRAETVLALTDERGTVMLEGILVDRCVVLGCWVKLRDESGEVIIDLAPMRLSVESIRTGSRIRVWGRIGKTREAQVGFVATRIEVKDVLE